MPDQHSTASASDHGAEDSLLPPGWPPSPTDQWGAIEDLWERAARSLRVEFRPIGLTRMLLWRDYGQLACPEIRGRLAEMPSYDLHGAGGMRSLMQRISLERGDLSMVLTDRPPYPRCKEAFELYEAVDRFLQRARCRPVGWR